MKRMKSALDVLATVLVIVSASLFIWRQFTPRAAASSRPQMEDVSGTIAADLSTLARGSGQLALVGFSDFECPYCGRHVRDVEPMIREAFVDTGVLRQVFVHLPLANHRHAMPASEASLCAEEQGKFWEMHDALFSDQKALDEKGLAESASRIGLDSETFSQCLAKGDAKVAIERHKRAAQDMKVQATPAFFLGMVQADGSILLKKRLNGALPFERFRAAIMELTPNELKSRIRDVALSNMGLPNLRRPSGFGGGSVQSPVHR